MEMIEGSDDIERKAEALRICPMGQNPPPRIRNATVLKTIGRGKPP